MSDYTKVNLNELENAAEGFGLADNLEARFARNAMGLEQFGFSYQKLQPSFRQPFGHTHKGQEEVYLVLEGSGRIKVEDEVVDLAQWDAVRVPAGVKRSIESGEHGLTLIAIGGTPTGDVEMLNGWWAD
jgi:uncharacterized cupin superfamily protein